MIADGGRGANEVEELKIANISFAQIFSIGAHATVKQFVKKKAKNS